MPLREASLKGVPRVNSKTSSIIRNDKTQITVLSCVSTAGEDRSKYMVPKILLKTTSLLCAVEEAFYDILTAEEGSSGSESGFHL